MLRLQEIGSRNPFKKKAFRIVVDRRLRVVVAGALVALLTVIVSTADPPQSVHADFNFGLVCNDSSTPIWLTLEPLGKDWTVALLPSGTCTNRFTEDVEVSGEGDVIIKPLNAGTLVGKCQG